MKEKIEIKKDFIKTLISDNNKGLKKIQRETKIEIRIYGNFAEVEGNETGVEKARKILNDISIGFSVEESIKRVSKMAKTAEDMASQMKEVSVAQFFEKNRHLLGYDNKFRALMTVIKEAVDNSLDACEEAGVLPEIGVTVKEMANERIKVVVEDNGTGITKEQIPKAFGKLLYGSKFHRLKQSRGQQGIGISAAVLYAQLTTNQPTQIWSQSKEDGATHHYTLMIDTLKNEPEIHEGTELKGSNGLGHRGTKIEIILEAKYRGGEQSVDEYMKQSAIANPHAKFVYSFPGENGQQRITYQRAVEKNPEPPTEIKPHPHGIELGMLRRMVKTTTARTTEGLLTGDFSRVGKTSALSILKAAKVDQKTKPADLTADEIEKILKAMQQEKLMKPPTECLSPITEDVLMAGLRKELKPEFIAAVTRPPAVYRGNPFQIEASICYGGPILEQNKETSAKVIRMANRVPLLYMAGACSSTEAVLTVNWKSYNIQQTGKAMPQGPISIMVHIASAWVPFTSESKDAIASYPEILEEMRLALQECGRRIGKSIRGKVHSQERAKRLALFEKYVKRIGESVAELSETPQAKVISGLEKILKKGKEQFLELEATPEEGEGKETKSEEESEEKEE